MPQKLIPFLCCPDYRIEVRLERNKELLTAHYRVSGNLEALRIPSAANPPAFRDELWKHTCFEIFAGIPGTPAYTEFNFSPSGNWARYEFSDYRLQIARPDGFRPDTLRCERREALELTVTFGPFPLSPLEFGITCVLEHANGENSYWALRHTAKKPDFHRRDSFLVRL